MAVAIEVENLSKAYQLGEIGTGTLSRDLERWWAKVRGKEDPFLKIGETNDRTSKSTSGIVWSLKDINFKIEQGDAVGIIGRNGAGKSTLLKLLSRVTSPTTGTIKVKGRIASLLEVGTGFHPELTGKENIYLNGAILGMRKKEISRKFDEIVAFAGVERYVDTPVKRYSSGMYVRLAFAVAAHLESEILIVDEVLAVGDAEFQKKCLGKMSDVSKGEGRTVLFVSHNMGSIKSLCQKGILLKNGTLKLNSDVDKCINSYLGESQSKEANSGFYLNDDTFEVSDFTVKSISEWSNFITSKPIICSCKYVVKKRVIGLRIGIDVIENSTQNIVFRTFHDDSCKEPSQFDQGTYESSACIPPNLLREGNYSIRLKVGIHNVRWIITNEIETVIDVSKIDGLNSNYNDERPGIVMPNIEWGNKKSI